MQAAGPTTERGQRFPWRVICRTPAARLANLPDLPPLLAHLLCVRGIDEPAAARSFLGAEHEPLAELSAMRGLPEALARIDSAIDAAELVAIYGDYDVDGLTATTILCRALRRLGGRVLPFIPHRELDGYGLNEGRLDELRQAGATLAVTVDCGITAAAEVARARAAGLDVIVTDHHPPKAELPRATVLNPRQPGCGYPFKELAGVGVAFRLAEALLRARLPRVEADEVVAELCVFAAIGTLADLVPLVGENRAIVRRGLARLNRAPGAGLRALIATARMHGEIDAERVSFGLVPRLNAAGRLDDARLALDLLLCESDDEAPVLAARLDGLNRTRRALLAEALEAARADLGARQLGPAIVLNGTFPIGIAGLVAGKLAEEFGRPAIVLRRDGEMYGGSARSVNGLDIAAALGRAADHLERFGGHPMAAGLRLRAEQLEPFECQLQAVVAEALGDQPSQARLLVEAELQASTAGSWETLTLLARLGPFGPGHPRPRFVTRGLRAVDVRRAGDGPVRLRLAAEGASVAAVAFETAAAPPPGARVDVVYEIRRDSRRGTIGAELECVDWRPSDL